MDKALVFLSMLLFLIPLSVGTYGTSPSKEDVEKLRAKLKGDLYLPGNPDYESRTTLLNTRFSARPGFIVVAEGVADVQHCVLFARKFKLRVTVLSSGHDYIGRAIADNSVHISLKRMDSIHINTTDPTSDTGASATIGPGRAWRSVYEEVDKKGLLAVGGSAPTVAAGGYMLGGGHSPMSPSLGLGVDSVMEFQIVTPDGSIITATNESITIISADGNMILQNDTDLFWGVRGGGPGGYGVVTWYKIKLHQPPPDGFVRLAAVTFVTINDFVVGDKLLDFYNKFLKTQITSKVGGYYQLTNTEGTIGETGLYYRGTISLFLLHFGGWAEASKTFEPLVTFLKQHLIGHELKNYSTFWDYQQNISDPTGYRLYIVNRFLHEDDFDAKFTKFVTETLYKQTITIGCTGTHLGGLVKEAPWDSSSVSRDFRRAKMSLSCGTGWFWPFRDEEVIRNMMENFAPAFYKLGKGVYVNEPGYYIQDWKNDYWGTNYDRLLKIKKRWDPNNMLQCHHCVGSDQYSHTPTTTAAAVKIGWSKHFSVFLISALMVFLLDSIM